jgi:hypothetical protein
VNIYHVFKFVYEAECSRVLAVVEVGLESAGPSINAVTRVAY